MKQINLHMHTNISDGDYSPFEVLDMTKKAGLDIVTISDHDTVEAYKKYDLFSYAKKIGIELIPGIEISTRDTDGKKYHIIGLFIDLENKDLKKTIKFLQKNRIGYVKKSHQKFSKINYYFDLEKILKEEIITKAHIADYIIADKKNEQQLEKDFAKIPTRGDFIETFMLQDQKAFVDQKDFTPREAIEVIQNSAGVAFLAHPSFNIIWGEKLEDLVEKFKSYGVDGFEAYNIQYNIEKGIKISEFNIIEKLEKACLTNNLLISGGSDFHTDKEDKIGSSIQLNDKRVRVPEKYFDIMKKLHQERIERKITF